MDHNRFDDLARVLSGPDSRRRVLGLLAAVPVVGGLLDILSPEETAAKDRRRRRKQRHNKRKNPGKDKQGKRKKKCRPESVAQTCAGRCGNVTNNCQQTVNCGSCACTPGCVACFTCQEGPNTPGACIADPNQQGDACGDPGQVCQADGTCACDAGSCTPPQTCGGDGVDGECGCTALTTCPVGTNCGTIPDGCGGTVRCGPDSCTQPTDPCQEATCLSNVCTTGAGPDGVSCNDGDDCTAGETCSNGTCGGGSSICTNPPQCRTTEGATCSNGICTYPQLAPVGQSCTPVEGGLSDAVCQADGRCCVPRGGRCGGAGCSGSNCCSLQCVCPICN